MNPNKIRVFSDICILFKWGRNGAVGILSYRYRTDFIYLYCLILQIWHQSIFYTAPQRKNHF